MKRTLLYIQKLLLVSMACCNQLYDKSATNIIYTCRVKYNQTKVVQHRGFM